MGIEILQGKLIQNRFEVEDGIGGPETAREVEWYRERIVFEM